jgi:hypothetical protein
MINEFIPEAFAENALHWINSALNLQIMISSDRSASEM